MNQTAFLSLQVAQSIFNDHEACARTAKLIYVNDKQEGIRRVKRGRSFCYYEGNALVRCTEELERIRKLVIPPAWTDVWICKKHNGHIQVTGIDSRKRKQYKYHPEWNALRNLTKFSRMLSFGEMLPRFRLRLEDDFARKTLCREKVLATVIKLMENTYIRIGNNGYEKLYGSYGLTTLKDQHVKIDGSELRFSFKGKKGIFHDISIRNKKLASIVKQCREIPGKELFQYYDDQGNRHSIHSEDVNAYIREITSDDFTAKDFRTWAGTVNAIRAIREVGYADTAAKCKQAIVEVLDVVSRKLGNTRTVCRKYYVHPVVFSLYEEKKILDFLKPGKGAADLILSEEEHALIRILKRQ